MEGGEKNMAKEKGVVTEMLGMDVANLMFGMTVLRAAQDSGSGVLNSGQDVPQGGGKETKGPVYKGGTTG
jgi:hypothetical protein